MEKSASKTSRKLHKAMFLWIISIFKSAKNHHKIVFMDY